MLSNSSSLEGRGLSHSVRVVHFNGGVAMILGGMNMGVALAWTAVFAAAGFVVAVTILA